MKESEKQKPVTLKDVALEAGVSLSTVSAALNNGDKRYSKETVQYVRKVANRLGYRPNRQARLLRGAKSRLIGIIKNISLHQLTAELALFAGEAIHETGYDLLSSDILWNYNGLESTVQTMLDARVEGIILLNQFSALFKHDSIPCLVKSGIPLVSLEGTPIEGVSSVTTDYYRGIQDLTSHYISLGYHDLVLAVNTRNTYVGGKLYWRAEQAVAGFSSITKEAGLSSAEVLFTPPSPPDRTMEKLYFEPAKKFMHELFARPRRPRAIIFIHDLFAIGALHACYEMGVSVPDEVAIAGIDHSAIGQNVHPRLTSLALPSTELSQQAVDLLHKHIQNPSTPAQQILLPPTLKVGGSCGACTPHPPPFAE